jgi:serine/threonine protein phosphatase PrpC
VLTCPKCGASAGDGDRFCEADGTPLGPPPDPGARCGQCGAVQSDDGDGYCSSCGHRLAAAGPTKPAALAVRTIETEGQDARIEEAPGLAACTHPGLRHAQNEDAVALASGETPLGESFRILVVCDGVSSSTRPERASRLAARVVRDTIAHACRVGDLAFDGLRLAIVEAIRSAHVAVCAEGIEHGTDDPPGTTCVAALAVDGRLTVGWVGDSRAYWLTDRGGELLTRDHSWVNDVVERGEATLEEALRSPYAHALTRCLGPLENADAIEAPSRAFKVDVVSRHLAGPGWLLLCSDGLWNYASDVASMGALVKSCGPRPTPSVLARALVHQALLQGGHDNVSVALFPYRIGP